MNILLVTYDYPPKPIWGMGQHVFNINLQLRKLGHAIKIVTVNRYNLLGTTDSDLIYNPCLGRVANNIKYQTCTDKLSDKTCLDELYIVAKKKLTQQNFIPDIIHCHGWMMFETAYKLARFYDKPIISTLHFIEKQYESISSHPKGEFLDKILDKEKRQITDSDSLICVSDYGYNLLNETYKKQYKKATIIYHGIDTDGHTISTIERKANKCINLIFVGRLVEEKGIQYLCEALDDAAFYGLVNLKIAGTGLLSESLLKKYGDKYTFLGYLEHPILFQHLQTADYIVIPSIEEQFGLVAAEGMLLGAIPIASRIGGLAYIIKDEINGFMFDIDEDANGKLFIDIENFRNTIQKAIMYPKDKLKAIRKNNYYKVIEQYSNTVMIQKIIQAYQETINLYNH